MPDITTPTPKTPAPTTGASPTTPHTHVKVIDEAHELFGRVCKIISADATFIVVELESAGSWIKSKLFHSQVAMTPAPVVVPVVAAPVVETPETTATTEEKAPAVEVAVPVEETVAPEVVVAPVAEAPAPAALSS